jgi:hypothetical protein
MLTKKYLSILLSVLMVLVCVGCDEVLPSAGESENSVVTVTPEGYKIIKPPEDGWTLELLNEVTYINGQDIDLPFCLDDLGEDFTVENVITHEDDGSCIGDVYYKGEFAFIAGSSLANYNFDRTVPIDSFILNPRRSSSFDLSDFLILNGISTTSSMSDCWNNLGVDYFRDEKNQDNEEFEALYSLFYDIDKSSNNIMIQFDTPFSEVDTNSKVSSLVISIWERDYE